MTPSVTAPGGLALAVFVIATMVALISARPYAGSWYDGSRLATVESLVDQGTWAIDDSIFVRPRPGNAANPYPETEPALQARGTQDKLLIGGQYFSDKSPVPAFFMAGVYQVLQWTTGLVAREDPARFCYLLTLFSSGLAYVIAVCCVDRLACDLATPTRLLVTASFAFATIALPYARQVNNHILLLAVACALVVVLAPRTRTQLVLAGMLIGVGYSIDLGLGPILVLSTVGLVGYRNRNVGSVILLLVAAFPWFALHHYLNWRIGGTFAPANVQPAYLNWPGSPFDAANMTGLWAHASVVHFVGYALDLLFGKRGFFGHDLALYLTAPGAFLLARRRVVETPEIIWASCFFVGGWLIYAATSTNSSGVCASIRWYVPLLAPAYYVLVVLLRHAPRYRKDLVVLASVGVLIGLIMWWKGPWMTRMVPGYWFFQIGALLAWLRFRSSEKVKGQA